MLNVQVTLRYHTVEDRGPRCTSVDEVWQAETPRSQNFQELISEVITIIFQNIVLVGGVSLAHSRDKYVIDFKRGKFTDWNLLPTPLINTILNGNGLFENERCVASGCCDVNS